MEGGVYGEVVGTRVGEASEIDQGHVLGMEKVVQRIAEGRVVRMEGVEHAASAPGIEQPAETFEEAGGVGPGNVVEIADDDGGFVELLEFLGEKEKLDISGAGAARGFVGLE